jgi:hypothetical protein
VERVAGGHIPGRPPRSGWRPLDHQVPQCALVQLEQRPLSCGNFVARDRREALLRHVIVRGDRPVWKWGPRSQWIFAPAGLPLFTILFDPFWPDAHRSYLA